MTGWRDPFLAPWPTVSCLLHKPEETVYMIISGGLLHRGPTIFLYSLSSASPSDPDSPTSGWTYLGPLIRPTPRPKQPGSGWTGDRGWNWECAGFFPLRVDGTEDRDVMIVSSQGDWRGPLDEIGLEGKVLKAARWMLWFSGRSRLLDQVGPMDVARIRRMLGSWTEP